MTGLEFEASVGAKMKTLRCDFTIDPLHLISFGLRVKHTTTVINAEVFVFCFFFFTFFL